MTKRFGSLVACDEVTLDVQAGEIHAIVGENGAGKSTLMGLLAGFLRPDEGEIRVEGEPLRPTPRHARAAGVGLCAQHFHQVPTLTGLENILLGGRGPHWLRSFAQEEETRVRSLMERYGLQTDLDRPVEDLSLGEQERIEILSLLHRRARVLILDEPTAVLAPIEVDALFEVLRELAAEGRAILFVTHKLPEVMAVAHRVTVLRRGRVVDSMLRSDPRSSAGPRVESGERKRESTGPESESNGEPSAGHAIVPPPVPMAVESQIREESGSTRRQPFDAGRLVAAIVGGDPPVEVRWRPRTKGAPLLEVQDLAAGEGRPGVAGVSVTVHEGEILGIGGVEGNGQGALVGAVLGHLHARSGTIAYRGVPRSAAQLRAMRSGTGVISEDRRGEGLLLRRDLADNSVLGLHARPPFSRRGWLDTNAVRKHAARLVHDYGVQPPELDRPAGTLSGGNQQRLLVGRELWRDPELLIAVHPTRGVDIAATRFIHAQLLASRDRGKGILLVSADLTELLALSDHVAILYRGQVEYEADRSGLEVPRLHRALLGLERTGASG